jgi:hypothetical protein
MSSLRVWMVVSFLGLSIVQQPTARPGSFCAQSVTRNHRRPAAGRRAAMHAAMQISGLRTLDPVYFIM